MALPMPFPASAISGRFGDPRGSRRHLGTDWAQPRGTDIKASGTGFVRRKGYSDLGGHHVVVAYANGEDWIYYHSDNPFPIGVGARVQEGTYLGDVGSEGAISTGPHVHVEVYLYPSSTAVDPLSRMDTSRFVGQGSVAGGEVIPEGDPTQLQLDLRLLAYYLLEVDGVAGPGTKAAVEGFQRAEGLEVDGIAGPITLGRLSQRVKELQATLNKIGNYGLVVDGQNGDKTAGAVRDLQRRHGLEVDGMVGPQTRAKIAELLAPPVVPPTPLPPVVVPPVVEPVLVTPTAADFPEWIRYEEKFDQQWLENKSGWNERMAAYYGVAYNPVESHTHWWNSPGKGGTHDGNVDYLNRTMDVGTNYVTSPGRVTLCMPLDINALNTGQGNPRAWKSENDPNITVGTDELGYKTLGALHYIVEKKNPKLRNEAIRLHKEVLPGTTECSNIDTARVRAYAEAFHTGELDIATGLPPVDVTPPVEPTLNEQIAEAYRDLGDLLEQLP